MLKQKREQLKAEFKQTLTKFVETLKGHVSTPDDDFWMNYGKNSNDTARW